MPFSFRWSRQRTLVKVARLLYLSLAFLLAGMLISLPPLQVLAQPPRKEKEKRLPKPPRTDAPTIKEDLTPALTTPMPPSANLPNLEETRKQKADTQYKKDFVEKPSTQCGFRDESPGRLFGYGAIQL